MRVAAVFALLSFAAAGAAAGAAAAAHDCSLGMCSGLELAELLGTTAADECPDGSATPTLIQLSFAMDAADVCGYGYRPHESEDTAITMHCLSDGACVATLRAGDTSAVRGVDLGRCPRAVVGADCRRALGAAGLRRACPCEHAGLVVARNGSAGCAAVCVAIGERCVESGEVPLWRAEQQLQSGATSFVGVAPRVLRGLRLRLDPTGAVEELWVGAGRNCD